MEQKEFAFTFKMHKMIPNYHKNETGPQKTHATNTDENLPLETLNFSFIIIFYFYFDLLHCRPRYLDFCTTDKLFFLVFYQNVVDFKKLRDRIGKVVMKLC